MDGTIPLSHLPHVLDTITEICTRYGLRVANIFHAGDGNLHPLVMYDANKPGEIAKAEAAGAEILKLCVQVGGCLSGEHGVGIEKRDLMRTQFTDEDLALQIRIKSVFDPDWLLNPGKVFPLDAVATALALRDSDALAGRNADPAEAA
jgi:glycolate oxidase